jgi:hypothetical protein
MSSIKLSTFIYTAMASLIVSNVYAAGAPLGRAPTGSDQNIPQPNQAQKSNVFHSGATSANQDPSRFTRPLSKDEVKAGNVPHMMPSTPQKPNKPIPDAPAGHKPHTATTHTPCPPGMEQATKIKDGNHMYILKHDGTVIDLDHVHKGQQHEKDEVNEDSEEARNLRRNPLLNPEEEKLREAIEKEGVGGTYNRPGHGTHEFGKAYNNKVYFKATPGTKGYKPGLWVEDSNATKSSARGTAESDPQGVKSKAPADVPQPKSAIPTPPPLPKTNATRG